MKKLEYHAFALALLFAWPVDASSCFNDGLREPNVFEADVVDRHASIGGRSIPTFLAGFAAVFYVVDMEATIRVVRTVRGKAPVLLTWKGKMGDDRQGINQAVPAEGPIVVYTSQIFSPGSEVSLIQGCGYDRGTYDDLVRRYNPSASKAL